jgi:glycosyltransferase involved in cell wall biosynthesis
MANDSPPITVVMCVYNGQRWLRAAIDSVLGQTQEQFELIVVDDGSTDGSPEIIRSCVDPRVRVIRQANQGLAAARNTGGRAARGRYVAYLDADDESEPERLRLQSAFLDARPEVAAVGCSVRIIDERGRSLFVQRAPTGADRCRARLFRERFYNYGSSLMIRREPLLRVGFFRTFFVQREDVDFMLRLAERFPIDNVPETLYRYRINTTGLSHRDVRVGLYYQKLAFCLHRERMAAGCDRLQRGEAVAKYRPEGERPPRPSSLRRVLASLHLDEAELLREMGCNWAAAIHVLRACWDTPASRGVLREGLRILTARPEPRDAVLPFATGQLRPGVPGLHLPMPPGESNDGRGNAS